MIVLFFGFGFREVARGLRPNKRRIFEENDCFAGFTVFAGERFTDRRCDAARDFRASVGTGCGRFSGVTVGNGRGCEFASGGAPVAADSMRKSPIEVQRTSPPACRANRVFISHGLRNGSFVSAVLNGRSCTPASVRGAGNVCEMSIVRRFHSDNRFQIDVSPPCPNRRVLRTVPPTPSSE